MEKSFIKKFLQGILIITLLFVSCQGPVKGGGETPQNTTKKELIEMLKGLDIVYASTDSEKRVTKDLSLTKGSPEYSVSWKSFNQTVITDNGKVTRNHDNVEVILTATITDGIRSASKDFKLTVYGTVKEALDTKVANASVSPIFVDKTVEKLVLSEDTTLKWSAVPSDIIKVDDRYGTIIRRPAEKTAVQLTVTAKDPRVKEASCKSFSVIVYPKDSEASDNDYFEQVHIPSELKYGTYPLKTFDGKISWDSSDPRVMIDSQSTAIIMPSFRDYSVTLKAKCGTHDKDFPVTVKRISEIKMGDKQFSFTDTTITRYYQTPDSTLVGEEYQYMLNGENQICVTLTKGYYEGAWLRKDEMIERGVESMYEQLFGQYDELSKLPTLTLSDFKKLPSFFDSDDKKIYERLKNKDDPSYEKFVAFDLSMQSDFLKGKLDKKRKEDAKVYCGNENASRDDIMNAIRPTIKKLFDRKFSPQQWKYTFTRTSEPDVSFNLEVHRLYEETELWHTQSTEASSSDKNSTTDVKFFKSFPADTWYILSINKNEENTQYEGRCNVDFTSFEGKNIKDQNDRIKAKIIDNKDGTIRISVEEGKMNGENFILKLEPLSLYFEL